MKKEPLSGTETPRKIGRPKIDAEMRRVVQGYSISQRTRAKIRATAARKKVSEGIILDDLAKNLRA